MESAVWELIKDGIASLGFPIFVAVYLLIHMKKTLKKLTDSIDNLIELIKSKGAE